MKKFRFKPQIAFSSLMAIFSSIGLLITLYQRPNLSPPSTGTQTEAIAIILVTLLIISLIFLITSLLRTINETS